MSLFFALCMFKPAFTGVPAPDMFNAGNDAGAKKQVTEILTSFGWKSVDLGSIEGARYLEPMAMAWITYGITTKTFDHAFTFARK